MKETKDMTGASEATPTGRRSALKALGRYAAVTAPTVALLLAAKTKPAVAIVSAK
jgi:hypothetical protein